MNSLTSIDKDSRPLISIITIVFNGEKHIQECVASILRQSYKKIEYIVIDGKSTDKTLSILNENLDVIDILVSEQDRGISDAFNKGIKLAKGELIGILNSDDYYSDNCVNEVVNYYLLNSKKKGIYYGNVRYFNESSSHIRVGNHRNIWRYTSVYHPSTFVSREIYEQLGGFSEKFKYTMDAEFFHRAIVNDISFFHIDKCLSNYRTTGTSDVNYRKAYQEFFYSVRMYNKLTYWLSFFKYWLILKKYLSHTIIGNFLYKRKHLIAPLLSGKISKG